MASSINEQEDNFLRFFKLVNGPGTEAVRIFFDSFFPNNTLDIVLRREENNIRRWASHWRLTQKQLDLLFPAIGLATSKEFDITLLIGLIRNFIRTIGHRVMPTNNDWNCLPNPNDKAKGDDLTRIKFHRNEMAHSGLDTLDTNRFKANWKNVKEAIARLSGTCLDQICTELETMRLDNISEVRKELKRLKADMIEYVNVLRIPGRDAQSLEIEMWENENNTFVKTDAVDTIINALQIQNCITVIGSFGQGKSALIQHVSLRLRDEEGYTIIPCRNPVEIKTWYEKEKHQIFIVDDLYGERCLMPTKVESWQDYAKFLQMILKHGMVKIIASSRPHIFSDANSKRSNDVFQYVIDLKNTPLTNQQKLEMLKMRIQPLGESEIASILKLSDADVDEHFPLLCVLYNNSVLSNTVGVVYFFRNRRCIHEDFINSLKKHDENSYNTILTFVLLKGKVIQRKFLNEKRFHRQKVKLTTLTKYISIEKDTFYKCLQNLTGTYFKKSRDNFLPIHNTLFDTLLTISARVSQQIIIQYLSSGLLFRHSTFTSLNSLKTDILIYISPVNEKLYFQRMFVELSKGKILKVFSQKNMNYTEFRQKFIQFIRNESLKDDKLVKRILNTRDEAKLEGSLPILPIQIASFKCWSDIVEMLVSYVDVNCCGIVEFSALHIACGEGDINTVRVLINNNANVNNTANLGQLLSTWCSDTALPSFIPEKTEISPLFVACVRHHKSIVKLLLENGASLNAVVVDEERLPSFFQPSYSPGIFLLMCAIGDIELVNLLREYGAKIYFWKVQNIDIPLD